MALDCHSAYPPANTFPTKELVIIGSSLAYSSSSMEYFGPHRVARRIAVFRRGTNQFHIFLSLEVYTRTQTYDDDGNSYVGKVSVPKTGLLRTLNKKLSMFSG